MNKLYQVGIILLAVPCMHFVANAIGLYDLQIEAGFVWFDNMLHLFVGVAIGLLCLLLIERYKPNLSFLFTASAVLFFVLSAAIVWELVEFAFFKFNPSHASELKIYSPTIQEAFIDIISNLAGALLLLVWRILRR